MSMIVVSGPIANRPRNGGLAWVVLSYALGLRRLGFDVHVIEELHSSTCTDSDGRPSTPDHSINVWFFTDVLRQFDLEGTLVIDGAARTIGMPLPDLEELAASSALLLNISGHLAIPELKNRPRHRAYLDLDPGYTQFWQASGNPGPRLVGHDVYFSVGGNLGRSGCSIPTGGIEWRPTRPPSVRDHWPPAPLGDRSRFTTVGSWRGAFGPAEFDGRTYGLKAHQFRRFLELPGRVDATFEVALDIHPADDRDRTALLDHGWRVVPPLHASRDPDTFRHYIQGSGSEFSVAQGVYVETNSGWFSDRSVRYLASGKPVLVQDTGLAATYPVGEGLVTFSTLEEAVAGAEDIAGDYERHSKAALALAEEFFDSDRVLSALLDEAGVSA